MSQAAGRNDSCPCGSGKKMKNCHPGGYGAAFRNRTLLLVVGGIAALAIVAAVALRSDSPAPTQQTMPLGSPAAGSQAGGVPRPQPQPQPPGPVPEGKVWSAEHGHWHEAPPATPPVTGVTAEPEKSPEGP